MQFLRGTVYSLSFLNLSQRFLALWLILWRAFSDLLNTFCGFLLRRSIRLRTCACTAQVSEQYLLLVQRRKKYLLIPAHPAFSQTRSLRRFLQSHLQASRSRGVRSKSKETSRS